jgi:argininosuccinate synthase
VITILVDAGQPEEESGRLIKAKKISDKHYTIDAKEEFVKDYIFPDQSQRKLRAMLWESVAAR